MTDERLTEHARTHLTGYGIESELCAEFLRLLDAEARASRAEQATVKADLARNAAEVECGLLRAALTTERERVIEACVRVVWDADGQDLSLEELTAKLRALSSLPTPPLQTQTWIPVGERLPEPQQKCLVAYNHVTTPEGLTVALLNTDGEWVFESDPYGVMMDYFVTHWQPLPSPPEEEAA